MNLCNLILTIFIKQLISYKIKINLTGFFSKNLYNFNLKNLVIYFFVLSIRFHYNISIFGFFIILTFISQIISGIMLAFSLVPECMLVPIVRDEEDLEDLYTDDFF